MTLLVALPRTTYSQNSTTCEERVATAKRIAQDAIDNAKAAEAREKEMKRQRDVAISEGETCQTDRDHAAKGEADCKTRENANLLELDKRLVEITQLRTDLAKQKRLTKIWTVSALVAGVLLGGAAGGYIGVQAAK